MKNKKAIDTTRKRKYMYCEYCGTYTLFGGLLCINIEHMTNVVKNIKKIKERKNENNEKMQNM